MTNHTSSLITVKERGKKTNLHPRKLHFPLFDFFLLKSEAESSLKAPTVPEKKKKEEEKKVTKKFPFIALGEKGSSLASCIICG